MKEETPLFITNNDPNSKMIENIYQYQISKIAEIKRRKCDFESNTMLRSEDIAASKQNIIFNDIDAQSKVSWDQGILKVKDINNEETPLLDLYSWKRLEHLTYQNEGIEIHDKAFSTIDRVDYELSNCEISTTFELQGESCFWLFLRAEPQVDEYTSIIKVSKKADSQKVFLSMGTFIRESPSVVVFKVFSKQQIVDKSSVKSSTYIDNDSSKIRLFIEDNGEEYLVTKTYLNDSTVENLIECDFFLPLSDKKKIILGGSGDYCNMEKFNCTCSLKEQLFKKGNITSFITDRRNCNCCVFF